jgi:hypothetical protein
MGLKLLKEYGGLSFLEREFELYDTFEQFINAERTWKEGMVEVVKRWEYGHSKPEDFENEYKQLRQRSINGCSYLEIMQKITQHYTFCSDDDEPESEDPEDMYNGLGHRIIKPNQIKSIKLYRGLHFTTGKTKDYRNIIKTKKIKTNHLSSFSEDFERAEVFATYINQSAGIVFSLEVPTEKILMSYKDWIHIQLEREYVLINRTNNIYNIKIEATYGNGGVKDK